MIARNAFERLSLQSSHYSLIAVTRSLSRNIYVAHYHK
jgi:hypothetical protein